jgi:hypothetical protein
VLIMGVRRGHVFVATEVLISADGLSGEAAVPTWIAQHTILLGPPCRTTAAVHKSSTEVNGS